MIIFRELSLLCQISCLLLAAGCGCLPDEKVGEIDLLPATNRCIAYPGSETLRFANAAGPVRFGMKELSS